VSLTAVETVGVSRNRRHLGNVLEVGECVGQHFLFDVSLIIKHHVEGALAQELLTLPNERLVV